MLRLLKFLLTGDWHLHQWEVISRNGCSDEFGSSWSRHYCRCKHCGAIKKFD